MSMRSTLLPLMLNQGVSSNRAVTSHWQNFRHGERRDGALVGQDVTVMRKERGRSLTPASCCVLKVQDVLCQRFYLLGGEFALKSRHVLRPTIGDAFNDGQAGFAIGVFTCQVGAKGAFTINTMTA